MRIRNNAGDALHVHHGRGSASCPRGQGRAASGMRLALVCVLTVFAGAWPSATCRAALDTSLFLRVRTLDPPGTTDRKVASFVLDDELFEYTRSDFGDIRVVNDLGGEVPYLPRRRVTLETDMDEQATPLTVVSLKRLADNQIEIVVEKDDDKAGDICALVVVTGLNDFEKSVSVDASMDQLAWEPVSARTMIYDYSRYVTLRQTRIDVDPGPFSYYRLRISAATESEQSPLRQIMRDRRGGEVFSEQEHLTLRRRDFRIDRVSGRVRKPAVRRERGVTTSYLVKEFQLAADDKTGDTWVTFRMPRVPVREVELVTDSANFARAVVLEAAPAGGEPDWSRVAAGTLVSVEVGDVHRRELGVVVQRLGRHALYRLRIKNGDSPALAVTALKVTAESWEVLFFHESNRTYSVYYGDKDVPLPSYDIENVVHGVQVTDVDYYQLGPPDDNPDLDNAPVKPFMSGKTLMIVMTVAVVGVLVVLIARATRALDSHRAPPG